MELVLTITAYDRYVEQLFEIIKRFTEAMSQAHMEYRIIGGMAVFLHVNERNSMAARLTNDVDAAVKRTDLDAIIRAVSDVMRDRKLLTVDEQAAIAKAREYKKTIAASLGMP